jgi:hypothetical protein
MLLKELSREQLIELAMICRSVYSGPINQKILTIDSKPLLYQKIIHGSFGRGYCRLFWNDNRVVIAFRGTREIVDWRISNLRLLPTKLKNCGKEGEQIKIQSGFQRSLYFTDKTTGIKSVDALYQHLENQKLLTGNKKIIITGHSLGGAIATLFAVKLRYKYPDIVYNHLDRIVLFGCPSVGLQKFKSYYRELNERTIRIVNGSDIVPLTPPFFYEHVGSSIWYTKNNAIRNEHWLYRLSYALRMPIKKFINDHSIEEYIETLMSQ